MFLLKPAVLLKVSVIGTVIFGFCCFTPLLVMVLVAIELANWPPHLDILLIPLFVLFFVLTIVAFTQQDKVKKTGG